MLLSPDDPAGEPHVLADGSHLVDDDHSLPVRVVVHLVRIRVVRGAEGVRSDPLHEREVVDEERVVVPLAANGGILVLAEAGEVERLAVDEELGASHLDGADADRLQVAVEQRAGPVEELGLERVQVAVAGCPAVDVGDSELAARSLGGRDLDAVGVAQDSAERVLGVSRRRDDVPDEAGRAVEVRDEVTSLTYVAGVA